MEYLFGVILGASVIALIVGLIVYTVLIKSKGKKTAAIFGVIAFALVLVIKTGLTL